MRQRSRVIQEGHKAQLRSQTRPSVIQEGHTAQPWPHSRPSVIQEGHTAPLRPVISFPHCILHPYGSFPWNSILSTSTSLTFSGATSSDGPFRKWLLKFLSISHREYATFIKLANGQLNKSYIKVDCNQPSALPNEVSCPFLKKLCQGERWPASFASSQEEPLNAMKSQTCQRASWKEFLSSICISMTSTPTLKATSKTVGQGEWIWLLLRLPPVSLMGMKGMKLLHKRCSRQVYVCILPSPPGAH